MKGIWAVSVIASILILGTLGIQESFAVTNISTCQVLYLPGETYVLTADIVAYENCFTIAADNITLDGDGHTINGFDPTPSNIGVFVDGRTGVTIKNLNVENFIVGILLFNSNDNTLTGNTATNNFFGGIELSFSNGNTLTGNTIQKNILDGFRIISSSVGNHINDNLITDNVYGIRICKSLMQSDNSLFPNKFGGAQRAIFVDSYC